MTFKDEQQNSRLISFLSGVQNVPFRRTKLTQNGKIFIAKMVTKFLVPPTNHHQYHIYTQEATRDAGA